MNTLRNVEPGASPRSPLALPAGTRVGNFVIESVLGSGGFGITYSAIHEGLDKRFALKEYFPSQFAYRDFTTVRHHSSTTAEYAWGYEHFLAEARALAKFKHPAIVDVSDVFTANETAYMVLAFEDAPNLTTWLRNIGRPPTQGELDALLLPILDALQKMHGIDMLHRDIAPDNILIRRDGRPVLIDFGAARDDFKHHAGPVTIVVKPAFSPPEQYFQDPNQQGFWSDIYSLGATLFYAVTRHMPEGGLERIPASERLALMVAVNGDYRLPFLEAINHALAVEPRDRPQHIDQWRAELMRGETTRKMVPHSETHAPISGKKGALAAVALCAAAGVAVFVAWPCGPLSFNCPARTVSERNPINLQIAMTKQSLAVGEPMQFSVKSDQDCHFRVYTAPPSGSWTWHDPNDEAVFLGSETLRAGEWRDVPVKGYATVQPPLGAYQLGVLCSREPLPTSAALEAQYTQGAARRNFSFSHDPFASMKTVPKVFRATMSYEVTP